MRQVRITFIVPTCTMIFFISFVANDLTSCQRADEILHIV